MDGLILRYIQCKRLAVYIAGAVLLVFFNFKIYIEYIIA